MNLKYTPNYANLTIIDSKKMLRVNFLSDFIRFRKFIGINGALTATINQAKVMQDYVNVVINDTGKNFDLVHSHGSLPYSYILVRRGLKYKKPIVISAHQTHHDTDTYFLISRQISLVYKKYLMRYYNLGEILICPTENSKKIVENELKIKKPIKLISNGIDIQKFKYSHEKRTEFRKKYGLDKTTILCVGMPTQRKGIFDFISFSRQLREHLFLWVGERAFLFQHNYRFNNHNLIMPGYVGDITAAYSSGDIFCFPSHYEGEGIAIIEAMSCGLPVILRDLPVYEDRFQDGKNCLKAKDNEEFVDHIRYLVDNPDEKKRLAAEAIKTAKKLDIRNTARSIYDTYVELSA